MTKICSKLGWISTSASSLECTLTGFDKIVNWYSDDVAICLKDGEDLKADANLLFKNGMLVEALEKYESVSKS